MTFIHVPRFYYYYIVIKAMWISNFVYQEFLKLFSINTFSFSHVRPFENFFPNKLYGSVIFQNCIRLWIFKNVRTFPELCWKLLALRSCHILLEEPGQNLHHLHILENNKMFKIFKVFFFENNFDFAKGLLLFQVILPSFLASEEEMSQQFCKENTQF